MCAPRPARRGKTRTIESFAQAGRGVLTAPALSALRSAAADGDAGVLTDADWDHLSKLAAEWQDLPPLPQLVAIQAPMPAPHWHLTCLRSLAGEDREGVESVTTVRRRYHARWLGRLLAPDEPAFRPLVTILIPVHNRADLVVEAVESCIRQTWRPLEIMVIDDGSTDHLADALRRYGSTVRLHRQPHRGVSSARNVGVRLAQGDFVHFLDSDDLLLPHAVESKIEAFLRIPDAELCYSEAEDQALGGQQSRKGRGPRATTDLLGAVLTRHPFLVPTVMMPRWSMLGARPFEEDLRRAEDSRYWFGLGLRGTKAIEIAEILTIRRKIGPSLNDIRVRSEEETVTVRARDLCDVLGSPAHWRYAPGYYKRLAAGARRYAPYDSVTGTAASAISRLRAVLADLAKGGRRSGLSPLPLFAALRAEDQKWGEAARASRLGDDLDAFFAALPALIGAGLRASVRLQSADAEYWLDGEVRHDAQPSLLPGFRLLQFKEFRNSGGPAALTWILRTVRLPPKQRDVQRFRRLRRKLRSHRLAAWLTWSLGRVR